MITFKQFLENQEQKEEQPQIKQRSIPVGGFGGWKIHLRTGPDDKKREEAYKLVLKIIENSGNKWKSKPLGGGEPDEKDITIYCGPKEEVTRAAKAIKDNPKLYEKLLPANGDVLTDDQLIVPNIPNVYGRFDASRLNTAPHIFHQYGCKGWSMLEDDVSNMIYNPQLYNKETACEDAYAKLADLFGKYFTG